MTLDLNAIKQRAEAATVCKRPWWEETVLAQALTMGDEPWDADYAYMAAMKPHVALNLIARVEELEALVSFLQGAGKRLAPDQIDRSKDRAIERLKEERDRWKERWEATVQDATEHRATVQRVRESVHTARHALHLTGELDAREVLHHITTAMETE